MCGINDSEIIVHFLPLFAFSMQTLVSTENESTTLPTNYVPRVGMRLEWTTKRTAIMQSKMRLFEKDTIRESRRERHNQRTNQSTTQSTSVIAENG